MNWMRVASRDQLQDDDTLAVAAGELQIALYRCDGEFYATDNICTHAFALLSDGFLQDGCIECPMHQARFDIRTGKVLCAPATRDLQTYAVKVDGDDVLIGVPDRAD